MPRAQSDDKKPRSRPTISPEAYENRLINKTYKAVEKRIDNGEATAAEYIHFLRLGSTKEKLELEKVKKENKLLEAKAKSLADASEIKELYTKVLTNMREYSGNMFVKEENLDDEDD